jgi:hypothetical protein
MPKNALYVLFDKRLAEKDETIRKLVEALKYARRFLTPLDHDTSFVDKAIKKAGGK